MNKNFNMNNVPDVIKAIAEDAMAVDNKFLRESYIERLESIREYCDQSIKKIKVKK